MSAPHQITIRVYYEDTDFSGFVYHANYLKFLERARTEFLRSLGIAQSELHRDQAGLAFVVSRIALDYLRPALMDDVLAISTTLVELRGASMRLAQEVRRAATSLVRADVTVASIRQGRPVRLPPALRLALQPASGP